MKRNPKHELAVGALLVAGIGILSFLAIQVGAFKVDTGTVQLEAVFDNVAGLSNGAVVAVAGVDVGRVTTMAIDQGRARVTLVVNTDIPVHEDALLRLRARSVLGEKYLELDPGTAATPALSDGDQIRTTLGQVEIDQMVTQMGPLLQAADPEAVSKAIEALSHALARDPERLERMVADTEVLLHNLRVASEEAPALVQEVRAAVRETRAAVAQVEPVLDRADALLVDLEGLSEPIKGATAELPALVTDARGAVSEARTVLSHVDASTDDLNVLLGNLKEIDLVELRRLLRQEGVLVRLRPIEVEDPEAP